MGHVLQAGSTNKIPATEYVARHITAMQHLHFCLTSKSPGTAWRAASATCGSKCLNLDERRILACEVAVCRREWCLKELLDQAGHVVRLRLLHPALISGEHSTTVWRLGEAVLVCRLQAPSPSVHESAT